mgnify:CR=1 FL=1
MTDGYQGESFAEIRRGRAGSPARAAAALGFSLLAHAVLVWRFPALRWRMVETRRPPVLPPIQLREAALPPPEAAPARPVFDPSRPGALATPEVPPPPGPTAADVIASAPPPAARPLPPSDAPPRAPELPPAPPFEPRLARLETEQRKVADAAAALPRRMDIAVERVARAPDIVPPTLLPSAAPPTPPVETPPSPVSSSVGTGGAGMATTGAPGGDSGGDWARDLARLWGSEAPADIAPARPIEDQLRLDLRVWRPPTDPARLYFEIRVHRNDSGGLQVLPRDVMLVQDCSESMTQPILDRCKLGLARFLSTLTPEDRFDIMSFAETPQRLFGEWRPATAVHRARAALFVENLRSRGKTDVLAFLEQVATLQPEPGRAVIAVLFTDGIPTLGLADNFSIIERFSARNPPAVSVFAFGAGRRVNRFLLDLLSHGNRGDSRVVADAAQVPEAIAGLAAELARPVLIEPRVRFSGDAGREVYPATLTNLYLDRPLVLVGRIAADAPPAAIQVSGRSGGALLDFVFPLDWAAAPPADRGIVERWAWQRILALISEHIRRRDPALVEEMLRVGRAYGIRIPYAEALETPVRTETSP